MVVVKKGSQKETKIKKVPEGRGIIHGSFSFNNTLLTLSKENGEVLKQVSAGSLKDEKGKIKYRGAKKATSSAAQQVAEEVIRQAIERGIRSIKLQVKKIGRGRN